jgi:hypothetical protein
MKSKRIERLDAINRLISFIVETDKDRHNPTLGTKKDGQLIPGEFIFAENGLLYFIDSYTKERIRPINHYRWNGFSEGGTMRHLVQQFAEFIMKGKQGFLNDYKEIWGWTYENTMKVRYKALEIGFIDRVDYQYERWAN